MALANTNAIVANADVNASFIPELWSDEVIASYKKNLVFANLVRKLNHKGKKGDTIYIPRPSRDDASRRADVTTGYEVSVLAYAQQSQITVAIDRHTEYSRLFDDFAQVQALESLRRFFVDDAGYAVSRAIDTDLINEQLAVAFSTLVFQSGVSGQIDHAASTYVASSAIDGDGDAIATLTTNYDAISDVGIRAAIRTLDLDDVPMGNRVWAVRPEVKEELTGLPRFTEQAFTGEINGGNTIRNGLIGDVYGAEVFVTNQLPTVETSAETGDDAGNVSLFFHQDSTVLVEQMGMRTQRQYKQEFLADLLTTDTIYGVQNLRDSSIVPMISGTL